MSLSPSAKSALKTAVLVLGASGVVGMGWIGMIQILRVDAFAKFNGGEGSIGSELGIQMTNVHMKAYEMGRLSAVADMDELTIRRDRTQLEMIQVRDGQFVDSDGEIYQFVGDRAVYHHFTKTLRADQGTHLWNEDLDLTSAAFTYTDSTKTLLVSGEVSGRLGDGDVTASDITIKTDTEEISAHDLHWSGIMQDPVQDEQRKEWTINGEIFRTEGDLYIYDVARATDGEIIVIADHVEHNRETDVLVATGHVKYWGLDANLKCEKATIYRDEKRALLEGNVTMFIKSEEDEKLREELIPDLVRADPATLATDPQGATEAQIDVLRDDENLRKFPSKVIADKIEYWYKKGERHAVITGSPFARQDLAEGWRLGWAISGYYDGEKKIITLKSKTEARNVRDVFFFLSIGDSFKANEITFSTDDENRDWSGKWATATVYIDEDDDGGGG